MKLSELITEPDNTLDTLINKEIDKDQLFKYLIVNGYIDDSYDIYISNFYDDEWSINDHEYLATVRSFELVDPLQQIDTPNEVVQRMREEDFNTRSALNVYLVDYLIKSGSSNKGKLNSVLAFISRNIDLSKDFVAQYIQSGTQIESFIYHLCRVFPDLISKTKDYPFSFQLVSMVLRFVKSDYIAEQMNENDLLKNIIEDHAKEIFNSSSQLPTDLSVFEKLGVKFHSVEELSQYSELIDYVYERNLYKINVENVQYFLKNKSALEVSPHFAKANYTTLLKVPDSPLTTYINSDRKKYIESVFTLMLDNVEESEDAIIELVNDGSIGIDQKEFIIQKQQVVLSDLTSLPEELWTFVLAQKKVKITWYNLEEYLNHESYDENLLNEVLNSEYQEICKEEYKKRENSTEGWKYLHSYIIGRDSLSDIAYKSLLQKIPFFWTQLPAVSKVKKKIFITLKMVKLSEESYSEEDNELKALLITHNFDSFKNSRDSYPLNGEIIKHLLDSTLSLEDKNDLCRDITLEQIDLTEGLAKQIGMILADKGSDASGINETVIERVLEASEVSAAVSILIKLIPTWSKDKIISAIGLLPVPYSKVVVYKGNPSLLKNEQNIDFVKLLNERKIISSYKESARNIRVFTKKMIL